MSTSCIALLKPREESNTMPPLQDPHIEIREMIHDLSESVQSSLNAAVSRLDSLRDAETRRVNEQMVLMQAHQAAADIAESKRIDAIRAVDANQVFVANERAVQQAAVLQNQVQSSAETLRSLVASTAATVQTQLTQLVTQFTERLSVLEQAQYKAAGSSTVSTPLIAMIATFVGGLIVFLIQRLIVK